MPVAEGQQGAEPASRLRFGPGWRRRRRVESARSATGATGQWSAPRRGWAVVRPCGSSGRMALPDEVADRGAGRDCARDPTPAPHNVRAAVSPETAEAAAARCSPQDASASRSLTAGMSSCVGSSGVVVTMAMLMCCAGRQNNVSAVAGRLAHVAPISTPPGRARRSALVPARSRSCRRSRSSP
jgi:hypothetical protein